MYVTQQTRFLCCGSCVVYHYTCIYQQMHIQRVLNSVSDIGSVNYCLKKSVSTMQALFMAGVMVGSYSFGWLSDRAGRKPSFFIAVVVQVNSNLAKWLVINFLRPLLGCFLA